MFYKMTIIKDKIKLRNCKIINKLSYSKGSFQKQPTLIEFLSSNFSIEPERREDEYMLYLYYFKYNQYKI